MAPGMPSYTKLSNGGSHTTVGNVYSIPPSPPPDHDKIRSSHTLIEMLSSDQSSSAHQHFHQVLGNGNSSGSGSPQHSMAILPLTDQQQQQAMKLLQVQPPQNHFIPLQLARNFQPSVYTHPQQLLQAQQQQQQQQQQLQKQESSSQERVNEILCSRVGSFNDPSNSDLKLSLLGREGSLTATVNVHTKTLIACSKFFASKLAHKQQQQPVVPYSVEISDCEDVEIYVLTIRLMYSSELKRMLAQESVPRVLAILKVASAIVFEAGITASLEYLEATPWSEDDEEQIYDIVSQLQSEYPAASRSVLSRLVEPKKSLLALPSKPDESSFSHLHPEEVLVRLLNCVLKATDDKARREMKALVFRLLRENTIASNNNSSTPAIDVSKEFLYEACRGCLSNLTQEFSRLREPESKSGFTNSGIAREVDNIQWLADILVDRGIAEELVGIWARETGLAELHRSISAMQRHEVSKITARLCVGLGRGQIMAPQAVRALLLATWLQPLMDDFSWIQRSKSVLSPAGLVLDKRCVEDGLCSTILTLSLDEQKAILMSWFDKFSQHGDDCPNLQRAFEVWWRRTFVSAFSRQQHQLQASFPA